MLRGRLAPRFCGAEGFSAVEAAVGFSADNGCGNSQAVADPECLLRLLMASASCVDPDFPQAERAFPRVARHKK